MFCGGLNGAVHAQGAAGPASNLAAMLGANAGDGFAKPAPRPPPT
jgi:hypothetical protein